MAASEGLDLTIRPVRPADRTRVVELTRDVWEGDDYIPRVFDEWLADAGAEFQAVEVDGEVVGVQRVRPYAPGLVWYEGLRVASSHRRRGIARAMLRSAIDEARDQGFKEMRLATGNEDAVPLFEAAGFKRLVDVRWWRGLRVEGGDPARIPDPKEAERLWSSVAQSSGLELYHGVSADFNGARDLGAEELAHLASSGMLRAAPGGRAVAGLRAAWGNNLAVAFVAGRGAALRDLLLALRYEADADGLDHVTVALPRGHPAGDDLNASGYDLANSDDRAFIYGLSLKP
ncbi:MAG TPA: GNAT family N-acetyltransferase [Candidatus Dormibacteraeota bacterium]|nr:GNAT family N-acetyltransferase [Candidatus Dormibacteraeota bacterium]